MRTTVRLIPFAAAAALAAPSSSLAADEKPAGIERVSTLAAGPIAGGNTVRVLVQGDLDSSAKLYFGDEAGTNQIASVNGVLCPDAEGIECDPYATNGWLVQATAPAHAAGKVDLSVRVGNTVLKGYTETTDDYVYYVEPQITSVTPAQGPLAGGNRVEINLEGLYVSRPNVTIGGVAATDLVSLQPDATPGGGKQTIVATVPAGAAAGRVDVKVSGIVDRGVPQNGTAVGATATADDYTYEASAPVNAPKITRVSGGPAIAGLGGLITISGSKLGGLKSVKVGTRGATVLFSNASQILAFAPALSKGNYPVVVTTATGSSTAPANLVYRSLF